MNKRIPKLYKVKHTSDNCNGCFHQGRNKDVCQEDCGSEHIFVTKRELLNHLHKTVKAITELNSELHDMIQQLKV